MRTSVEINSLKIFANHGMLAQERVVGNKFEVSVRLDYDFAEAASSDDVTHTVNYAEVADIVKHTMSQPCALLETAAWNIRKAMLMRWPDIKSGRITVLKLHPPFTAPVASAGVTVEW